MTVKEVGKRQETQTYEEIHEKTSQAWQFTILSSTFEFSYKTICLYRSICALYELTNSASPRCASVVFDRREAKEDPKFELGNKFGGLQSIADRQQVEKDKKDTVISAAVDSKYSQAGY